MVKPETIDCDPGDLEALSAPITLLDTDARRIVAPNRIVYQPMEGNDADPAGAPSEVTLIRYRERAAGRAGIDFVEALAVGEDGKGRGDQLLLTERNRAGFERLVSEYRERNEETPILFQLTHSGRFAESPVSPYPLTEEGVRLLTDDDMARIQDDLVAATRLTAEVGGDGIDFKHCHGYLFGAMLGPANRERPGWSWGGETLEERARFFVETNARMREEVPGDRFLYTVRLSAFEGIIGGFGSVGLESDEEDPAFTELRAFARLLEENGVRLINQSSGVPEITPTLVRQTNENPLAFFEQQKRAEVIKGEVSVPVVGSGYSYLKAGKNKLPGDDLREKNIVTLGGRAIREGRTDLIGIGRQCLSDPEFAKKLLAPDFEAIRWDTSCNQCALSLRSGIHAGCVTYEPYYRSLMLEVKKRAKG